MPNWSTCIGVVSCHGNSILTVLCTCPGHLSESSWNQLKPLPMMPFRPLQLDFSFLTSAHPTKTIQFDHYLSLVVIFNPQVLHFNRTIFQKAGFASCLPLSSLLFDQQFSHLPVHMQFVGRELRMPLGAILESRDYHKLS